MIEVEITREAPKALLTTLPPERDIAIERTDDGYYLIKMNVDSLLQLMDLHHEEETLSNVIVRLVSERMDSGRTRP